MTHRVATGGRTALVLSAVVLLSLVLVQFSRLFGGNPALADMVNQSSEFQMLAVDAGVDDVVLVVDQRAESVLVYQATQTGLKFLGKRDAKDIFAQARASAGK